MNDSFSHRVVRNRSFSRRAFLVGSGIGVLSMAGCGDQSSNRQFAGDPRTEIAELPQATPGPREIDSGSPTAVPTLLPISALLAPRSDLTRGIVAQRHALTLIEVASPTGQLIWSNAKRAIWAAAVSPSATTVALLTSKDDAPVNWAVEFVDATGENTDVVEIGDWTRSAEQHPDAVTGGSGGVAWLPDSDSVVIALPTGGLLQVFPDGSQIRVAKAMVAKRPSAVAVSPDGSTIAFVDQPSGADGSGVFAGSMKAKPIDPIVVLPADRSGNRYAREVAWVGTTARVATIIDREELGNAQGDLFFLDTHTQLPQLVWTSPAGRDVAGVESFAVSADTLVTAFLTNPVRSSEETLSSLWLKQTDGATVERFDLPVGLFSSRIAFTLEGVLVTGVIRGRGAEDYAAGFLLDQQGKLSLVYRAQPAATPVASPAASPAASPVGTPSPVAVTSEA